MTDQIGWLSRFGLSWIGEVSDSETEVAVFPGSWRDTELTMTEDLGEQWSVENEQVKLQ